MWRKLIAGYGANSALNHRGMCLKYGHSDEKFVSPSKYKVFPIPCTGVSSIVDIIQFHKQTRAPSSSRLDIGYQSQFYKRTKYSNILTMPHRHPARHAGCGNDKDNHNTVSTLPPTAPANASTNRSSAAVQNTLYNVWCCRCGRLLNLQNVHYVHTCLCAHRRCDRCQTTPL